MRFVLLLLLVLTPACVSTVHQAPVVAHAPALHAPPLKVPGGYVLDAYWRDTYNGLIAVYGNLKLPNGAPAFVPALTKDRGLTALNADQWFMTDAAARDWITLNDLKRRGATP